MSLKDFVDAFLVGLEDVEIHNRRYANPIFTGRVDEIPEHLHDFPVFQVVAGYNCLLIFLDKQEEE